MTENQKQFSAFIESVCQKCGCTEATEALQKGFAALCESYDPYEDAARSRVINQLRGNITVKSPDGTVRAAKAPTVLEPERRTKVIGQKTRDQIAQEVDAEHPEFRDAKGNMAGFDAVKSRDEMIAQRMTEQFEKNNETMAKRNAAAISRLPYEQVKEMFPNAYIKVQGEVWHRKYLRREKDKATGEVKITGASGEWLPESDPGKYTDQQTALTAAKRKFSSGHWKMYTVIPELQQEIPNVIPSDA